MLRPRVLRALVATMLRETMRTPEAMFWTYGFPVLMAVVLGLAFDRSEPDPVQIAVPAAAEADALAAELAVDPRLAVQRLPVADAERALARGRIDLWVARGGLEPVLHLDPTRPTSELARLLVEARLQRAAGRQDVAEVRIEAAPPIGSRYIDFLIPGLIGLNLLGSGMWGIGYNLVHMRTRHLLRRLVVSPMGRAEFLLAVIGSRLFLVVFEGLLIGAFGMLVFDVPLVGSFALALLLVLVSGLAFGGLGILVAARPQTTEAVSGIMNLVLLPMWLLGGSFFSNERFPDWTQPVIQALPLTRFNEAMRAVMLEGAGPGAIAGDLLYLAAFGLVSLVVAVRIFRWS